jgi:hypothetical protein
MLPGVMRLRTLGLTVLGSACLTGCTGAPVPGDPAAPPPPVAAWRPAEALAMLLKPPPGGARPIDDAYLDFTEPYRIRIAEAETLADGLRRIERVDGGGRRVWYFDGPEAIFMSIDIHDDGSIDQSQFFGPEGLFAVVHRFAEGRRTQRIFWPPGQPRIVEVRDNLPPYPGVWWRTDENPFEMGAPSAGHGSD